MITEPQRSANETHSIFLELLQALALEIQSAIQAIAANSLAGLEASVAQQEQLCASLTELATMATTHPMDAYLRKHIRSAADAVRRLNLEYGALLRHSSRSIALLAALCRNAGGEMDAYPLRTAATAQQHTFSLEI